MTIRIEYESDGFPSGAPVVNGLGSLTTSWDELLWAALTVGRPRRYYVFRYGAASIYEAIFRLSMTRMALEQKWSWDKKLRRTDVAQTLDPSEKGAINYFLGLVVCKLFAAKSLQAPWLLHLDVFRPTLDLELSGRSRPDLIGETLGGDWIALESKGRVSSPTVATKTKAKEQAQRLISVNGVRPAFNIGGIAYFKNEELKFYWCDPEPDINVKNPIKVNVESEHWRYYYSTIFNLIRSDPEHFKIMQHEPILMPVKQADIKIGIHPAVLRPLIKGHWDEARSMAKQAHDTPYQVDGIAVVAGQSWQAPLPEPSEQDF